jgi:hypothetical protein
VEAAKTSGPVPVLPIVNVLDGGVAVTGTSPNAMDVVTGSMSGTFVTPESHVSCATASPPASVSLVNMTVAVCDPVAPVGGRQRTSSVLFGGIVKSRVQAAVGLEHGD